MVSRRQFLSIAGGGAAVALVTRKLPALGGVSAHRERADTLLVYLSPTCECCSKWVAHMKRAGFEVETKPVDDVDPIKRERNIPEKLWSCHTAVVGPYVVEGHVPADAVRRLLKERPPIAGIAVAGMPMGSPGMEQGEHKEPFDIKSFTCCGDVKVFAKG